MNKISQYNYITVKELIFIHAYVTGEEISDRQALEILKQLAPEEIPGTIKQSRRYCIRENGEELFEYYRKKQPKLFETLFFLLRKNIVILSVYKNIHSLE
ncbi:hypothetical protein ACT4UM_08700, partial [Bacillus sp. SS-TM]